MSKENKFGACSCVPRCYVGTKKLSIVHFCGPRNNENYFWSTYLEILHGSSWVLMWNVFFPAVHLQTGLTCHKSCQPTQNGGLDLAATNYPNMCSFVQQTCKVGVLWNTNTKSRRFVQFPQKTRSVPFRILHLSFVGLAPRLERRQNKTSG